MWYSFAHPPSYPKNSSIPETLWNTERFLYEIIRYCETKQFWRKVVVPLKPLTFLDTRNFLKFGRVSLRTFPVVWDNTVSTTNRDPPHLSMKYFQTRKFLKHRKLPPPKLSRVFSQKFSMEFLILPTFYPETFSLPDFFWNTAQKDSPKKDIGTVRQKFFGGKSWYSPFLFKNLLANDNFPKHSTGLFAYDVIRYCDTKNIWHKIVILSSSHPSYPKISSISEFFWNTEGFPYEIFRHCETTIFL